MPRAASQWRRGAAALLLALLPRDWRVRPPCLSVPLLCGGGRVHAVRQDTRWTDARACPAAWTRRREGVAGLRSRRSPSTARPSTCVLWRRRTTPPLAGAEAEAENDLFTNRAGCGTAPAAAATRTRQQLRRRWCRRRTRGSLAGRATRLSVRIQHTSLLLAYCSIHPDATGRRRRRRPASPLPESSSR